MINKFKTGLKSLFIGMQIGVYWNYKYMFHSRIPMCICWVISVLLIPLNVIASLIGILIVKNFKKELVTDVFRTEVEMREEGLL